MSVRKYCFITGIIILLSGCGKFLDQRPESSLVIPSVLSDLQALLNSELLMNDNVATAGDVAADDYWIPYADWSTFNEEVRGNYLWDVNTPPPMMNWTAPYGKVYTCNLVLESVDKFPLGGLSEGERAKTKGEALFLRSWAFYQLAQIFSMPYAEESAETDQGIPLRATTDVNVEVGRSSVAETYTKIENDLKLAAGLLPTHIPIATRPGKGAAYAVLSRVYLAMGDYQKAGDYADSCLQLHSQLIDYNGLDTNMTGQFPVLNPEVVFHARGAVGLIPLASKGRVSADLYAQYEKGDLRRPHFFKADAAGVLRFHGDYAGQTSGVVFAGITTAELILTRAECLARAGKVQEALKDMDKLLRNRYLPEYYVRFHTSDKEIALDFILNERRKELVFRLGIRWVDIRRLNQDPRRQIILKRTMEGKEYTLPPNDRRFAHLIPFDVVDKGTVNQTIR